MQQWKFYLDDQEVGEPNGWDGLKLTIIRDKVTHGIMFEASTSALIFYGPDAEYLREKERVAGYEANVVFRAESDCDNSVITGRLDFGTFKYTCGQTCSVEINMERDGCLMMLKNRMSQKVDLSLNRAFDKMTVLPDYPGLNFDFVLNAQELFVGTEGNVKDEDYVDMDAYFTGSGVYALRPDYLDRKNESMQISNLEATFKVSNTDEPITPQVLVDDVIECFGGGFQYEVRLKGRYDMAINGLAVGISNIMASIGYGEYPSYYTVLHNDMISAPSGVTKQGTFDITHSGTVFLPDGAGFYAMIGFVASGPASGITGGITFDKETYIKVTANKLCPPTESVVSMVHETGSRIVESITNGCMRLRSEYYGRTDSKPFSFAGDGCGGLRILTSGLRLRNAKTPTHFLSLQEYFNGLRGIDNVGMGIEDDPVFTGKQVVRVEPVEYFYKDEEVFRLLNIPISAIVNDPGLVYSKILIGYSKWEVQKVNGLDEPNSNKEFRTGLSMVENELNAISNFVAGGMPIEITRQQTYSETGAADTSYDNDTFIICVKRESESYYTGFFVEQGGVGITEVYSAATILNWRIRPRFNLMRWWKSIIQSYANLENSTSQLYFMAGTGNLLAAGRDEPPCNIAAQSKRENEDMNRTELLFGTIPIFKPKRVEFEYPLSVKEYNLLKTNPYGYISIQCGGGDLMKAYIQTIEYTPSEGIAKFNLLLKWDTQ